jgi:hypothetical protein
MILSINCDSDSKALDLTHQTGKQEKPDRTQGEKIIGNIEGNPSPIRSEEG